ncbi:MAG: hypothetical protein IPM35_23715 [Myxococcales bacterium]|nr:hypothetical protein [Myxococcales bacterium]
MVMRRGAGGLVLGLAAYAFGCGGQSDGDGNAADFGAEYASYCKKMADREAKCGDTPDEAACVARKSCFESHWRTSALLSAFSCDAARDCNTGDDACYGDAGAKVSSPALSSYKSACNSWLTQCSGSDDMCAPGAGLLSDATLSELSACMQKPCAEAATCVEAVMAKVDCWG